MSAVVRPVTFAEPQATLSVVDFIQERGYDIDNLYIDRFWSSISDEQWLYVSNELLLWMGYTADRSRQAKEQYLKLVTKHFKVHDDYKQLKASEIDSFYVVPRHDIETSNHNKTKHLLVSPDCFKGSLMMMKTEKAHEIRMYYISLVCYRSIELVHT
jgi:phage anti-repressor protein